jgi:hypothetical protein
MDAPAVGAQHLEAQALELDDLVALGQAPSLRISRPPTVSYSASLKVVAKASLKSSISVPALTR